MSRVRLDRLALALVLSLSVGVLAACNRQPEQTTGQMETTTQTATQPVDDVATTTSIQAQLYSSDELRGGDIDVSTNNGVVTLRGTVQSEAAREQALMIARQSEGITRVDDQLTVRAEGQQQADATREQSDTAATTGTVDDRDTNPGWITTKIQAQYFVNPEIKPWNIDVTTVSGGVVTLRGEVDAAEDKTEAVRVARNTEGVTRVVDNLRVRGERDEAAAGTVERDAADRPAETGNVADIDIDRDEFSDPWLTTKIQAKYFVDADVGALDIDVTTQNGVVTLTGTVENEAERRQAVALARNTDGVQDVRDQLRVQPEGDQADRQDGAGASASRTADNVAQATEDTWITTKIQASYFLDGDVKGHEINVDTRNGVVTLNGSVESNAVMQEAEQIASEIEGVTQVQNNLTVASVQR